MLHEGQALVADFGIALSTGPDPSDRMTLMGMAMGTPRYMSPEQTAGALDVDARTDVFGLGVILHEMLAGEPPSPGTGARTISGEGSCPDGADARVQRDAPNMRDPLAPRVWRPPPDLRAPRLALRRRILFEP